MHLRVGSGAYLIRGNSSGVSPYSASGIGSESIVSRSSKCSP